MKEKEGKTKRIRVTFDWWDVNFLKKNWSQEKCEEFLKDIEDVLENIVVSAGYDEIRYQLQERGELQ